MKKKALYLGLLVSLLVGGCKEKYMPKTSYPFTGYLVVEGYISADAGMTTFRVSRTTALDSSYYRPETGATLAVESENNASYQLYESVPGTYTISGLPIQSGTRYRLRITTSDARAYLSQYSAVRITPAIDSVSWAEKNNGIQFYVTTHGAATDTGYYKWRFDETWKYNSKYYSELIWDANSIFSVYGFRQRNQDELIWTCWKSDTSSDILLGSTAKLSANVLNEQPVTFISYSEDYSKLYLRYSINVYMESISGDEYDWYSRLKKNTESVGSIFDAQPSELTGNIQSLTNPGETVIGWIGCHSVTQKRIFIGRGDLPSQPFLSKGYETCLPDTTKFDPPGILQAQAIYSAGKYQLPVEFISSMGSTTPSAVIGSSEECVDCRLQGGSLTEPSFWIE